MHKEAIQKVSGPCVILAGAGTGKTYTLVEKVKHIINNSIYPSSSIVCLTFSNEAVHSLSVRILKATGREDVVVRTFHSFCADLLKAHGSLIGIPQNFKILLPDDAKIMLHKNFKTQPYYCHKYVESISIAKDLGISLESIEEYSNRKSNLPIQELEKTVQDLQFIIQTNKEKKKEASEKAKSLQEALQLKKFAFVWKAYEKIKQKQHLLDYADLNKEALELLRKNPKITSQYKYIIIDEFQDTNKLQCDLIELLGANITIVGDMNQSIYRFRGAYKNNFENFKKAFSVTETDIFALDKSFRCPNTILNVANTLIAHNYTSTKTFFNTENAHNLSGNPVKVYELKNAKEEVRKIIEIIKESLAQGTEPEEICVMFRTHQQSRLLKKELEFQQIPFTSITRKPLFKVTPVRISLAYLTILNKISSNMSGGEGAWWDLIYYAGFSKDDITTIGKYMREHQEECLSSLLSSTLDSLEISETGKKKAQILMKNILDLKTSVSKPLQELVIEVIGKVNPVEIEKTKEGKEMFLTLQKFSEWIAEYAQTENPDLGSFLYHIEIMNTLGIDIDAPELETRGIRIMTNHAAKGLEYKTVIVSNLAQKRFPMEHVSHSILPLELSPEVQETISSIPDNLKPEIVQEYEKQNQLAEERRLCYVAFTRAKENLILTYAQEYGGVKHLPSQFLSEIIYTNNPSVSFIQDLEEKSLPIPVPSIAPADSLSNPYTKFSPSSLYLFKQCQKRYEYKYVYQMPDKEPIVWDAIRLGSFVHAVFEEGVARNFKTESQFLDYAKELQMKDEWKLMDINEAIPLIRIFFERNKDKYNEKSITEARLKLKLAGMDFEGYADRVDFHNDGIEIIDYKTGKYDIAPTQRNWQLGFYALACQKFGKVKKVTLDMLKKDKAIEFAIDEEGNALETNSKRMSFNLNQVKQELIDTAQQILNCYDSGFKPCSLESNCEFCNEYVWDKR